MHLRGKQKRYLRSLANSMRPIFTVGKAGLNQRWLTEVERALRRRELVKIKILPNAAVTVNETKEFFKQQNSIQVIQVLGKTLLLFAVSTQPKYRKISTAVGNI